MEHTIKAMHMQRQNVRIDLLPELEGVIVDWDSMSSLI